MSGHGQKQGEAAMPDLIFKTVYIAALVVEMMIRAPFNRQRRQTTFVPHASSPQEILLLGLLFLGGFFLPMIYLFTTWLSAFDYILPVWAGWLGVGVIAGALGVFWRSHVDLGQNWTPVLQLREGHSLVTSGIYRHVRHPMYASQWLWMIAQALLLQNWLAGIGGALLFLPMYFIRVPQEEQMMIDQFGDEYRAYMQHTGRILPRRAPE
jgi:protein-S-isoprenylcysteine O-methyltransferase Ste14